MEWKTALFVILLGCGELSWATPEDVNVLIPLEFRNLSSRGLVYQGEEITPEEAVNLYHQGVDLDRLNPREGTDVWKNEVGHPLDPQDDSMLLDPSREAEFLSTSMQIPGTIELTVQQKDAFGVPHIYVVRVGRKTHSISLRKAMLRKIGHTIPPGQHVKKLKIRLRASSSLKRNKFLKKVMWQNLAASPSRWISNFYGIQKVKVKNAAGEFVERERYLFLPSGIHNTHPQAKELAAVNPEETLLEFQDIFVYPITNNNILDLGLGFYSQSINQDLRLLNAVILVYALTDVPESINKFSWHVGRIKDRFLVLPYEEYPYYSKQYRPNYEDALWIMRRIAQLDRGDFEEMLQTSPYPGEISAVIQEKLIARRNHLVKILNLKCGSTESPENCAIIPHKDPRQMNSENITEGIVTKDFWEGYGSRFAHDAMESPLSGTEVFAFFKSKGLSILLNNFVHEINRKLSVFDLESKWRERQLEIFEEKINAFIKTGKPQKTPLGLWMKPTINGRVIFGRDVVIGPYLGIGHDSNIHLVDTFGFAFDTGIWGELEGLTEKLAINIKGNVFFSRNYAHVKPIKSIKKSFSEPLRHILVIFYKKKTARLLNEVLENPEGSSEENSRRKERIKSALKTFSNSFQVGESLIISDIIGGQVGAVGRYGLDGHFGLQGQVDTGQRVINRLHIYRADKNTIHVYKDRGNLRSLRLALSLRNYIPIIGVSLDINSGKAKTLYHRLDINSNEIENPFFMDNIRNLKNILSSGSLEMFHDSPITIEHHFSEKISSFQLLAYKRTKLKSKDRIAIIHPNGEKLEFLQGKTGRRKGRDLQSFGLEIIDETLDEVLKRDLVFKVANNNDPGNTFKGRSQYRLIKFDSLVSQEGPIERLDEKFMHVNYRWKGHGMSARDSQKLIDKINNMFSYEFFNPLVLSGSKKMMYYVVDLNIFVYEPAIDYFLSIEKKRAEQLFNYYSKIKKGHPFFNNLVQYFDRNRKKCIEKKLGKEVEKALNPCIKVLSLVEKYVKSTSGLIAFLGGPENFRMEAQIAGHREGDELTYESISSNVFGEAGAARPLGPLNHVLRHPDFYMLEGEFFIYWLMMRL